MTIPITSVTLPEVLFIDPFRLSNFGEDPMGLSFCMPSPSSRIHSMLQAEVSALRVENQSFVFDF